MKWWSALPVMILTSVLLAQESEVDSVAAALRRLHPVLVQYHGEMEEMPADLMDLYHEGFLDDPSALFLPGSLEARLAATLPAWSSSSFRVMRSDWFGFVVCTEPDEKGIIRKLHVDGHVEESGCAPTEFFGCAPRPAFTTAATAEELGNAWARLGVTLGEVEYDYFDKGGFMDVRGAVLVKGVIPGYRSGYHQELGRYTVLRPGDRLIRVGGRLVESLADVNAVVPHVPEGRELELRVLRDGEMVSVRALSAALPGMEREVLPRDPALVAAAAHIFLTGKGPGLLGVNSVPGEDGVTVTAVSPGSAAAAAGMRVGDVIRKVAGHTVENPPRLTWLIRAHPAGTPVEIRVLRDGGEKVLSPVLGGLDDAALAAGRFEILANQLDVDGALKFADQVADVEVLVRLIKERQGSARALRWVDQAIEKPSSFQTTFYIRGRLLRERAKLRDEFGQWQGAVADLTESHRILPVGPPPHVDIADILWAWRQRDAALMRYRQARELEKQAERGMLTLRIAECLAAMDRKEEARAELESITNDPIFGGEARERLSKLR